MPFIEWIGEIYRLFQVKISPADEKALSLYYAGLSPADAVDELLRF